ncbi:MAG TPA: DUF6036 family nucleotidyltransferase [Gammaproteobacteria bacterium]
MRNRLTRESLHTLMRELARSAKPKRSYRIYLVGGGTAVLEGWRESSIDADLYAKQDDIFRDVQDIKERLNLNIEFARPEDFVPPLEGSESRHVLIETVDRVSFYHYDPYAQLLSKVVRGFARDLADAKAFVRSGMVDPRRFKTLVQGIPDSAYSKYPRLSPAAVRAAVDDFLSSLT